jgi:hypothetical protein
MTTTQIIEEANALVARNVTQIWVAVLILIQKDAITVEILADGTKVYTHTGTGQTVDRRWLVNLNKRGLAEMWAGQPRLTTDGKIRFFQWVNKKI